MDLVPFNEEARQKLVDILNKFREPNASIKQTIDYVVQTASSNLVDIACLLINQATGSARSFSGNSESAEANKKQLLPFFILAPLLRKSPQISSLVYNYFENSSFQPLPEDSFKNTPTKQDEIAYAYPGFDDTLVREILTTYSQYLTFNPKWFGSVWNWSELGRYIALHPDQDIRYLAYCCLSIITRPSRHQHMLLTRDLIREPQALIEQQMKYSFIYRNKTRPLVEARTGRGVQFARHYGREQTGQYSFCVESMTKVANILMLKRDISRDSAYTITKVEKTISKFVPVVSICDTISKIAYAASISKPCLIRGPTGSGKTAILDFIAAHTNRVSPPDYVKVQVGDQIDSKSLVGSYVCTEIPGQFEWQAGPLTQAMAYGSWIVFEDIDSAPSEMSQVIHSVIENGNLSCVSCCPIKMENPHPDFRIFFTQRTRSANNKESLKLGFGFIERLCDVVDLPEMSDSDITDIIEKRYKFGDALTGTIVHLFRTAANHMSDINVSRGARAITLRDLLKFCDRVTTDEIQTNEGKLSSCEIDCLLAQAIECFISSLPMEHILAPARTLGEILNKPPDETNAFLLRKPQVRDGGSSFQIGRAKLEACKSTGSITKSRSTLAPTRQSLQLLESVSMSVEHREPILLVGETGVGKTTIIQHLADIMNIELTVINLSQQSDSVDLLGGYRPIEMRDIISPINEQLLELFPKTFNRALNEEFLNRAEGLFLRSKKSSEWRVYLGIIGTICTKALEKEALKKDMLEKWTHLSIRVRKLFKRLSDKNCSPMALSFSEGTLLQAMRKGKWILLDEVNLAEPDVLQCLLLILDSLKDSRVYMHCDDDRDKPIFINPSFKIFACMNPSTDIGKRDLPIGIRGRFTEFFLDDVDEAHDLRLIVQSYVGSCLKPVQIESIVSFYREVKVRSQGLSDVNGNAPIYSLRTLCRALVICAQNVCRNMEKSLLESLKITFLQQLNEISVAQVLKLIKQHIFKGVSLKRIAEIEIPMPQDSHNYIQVEKFWIRVSSQKREEDESYILTKSVKINLERICRILCLGERKLPILIQGNTSVGKTSLINYLARLSGNVCFRINNHEHTDLQEYVGKYVLKEDGELKFEEGLLVTAMRKGYWVILDELNLAPCELLEALNRVLDDNREIFIPETRETVRAHAKFVLFATQNPPEEYAGRKLLSRAFRNRFIELHFDEIPHKELEEILHKRCHMPPKYAEKILAVMKELHMFRRESGCFGGKGGFMTMRDLFRWGQRYLSFKNTVKDGEFLDWDEYMASEGLILLEGRVRTINEADIVKSIIEKVFKRKLDRTQIYAYEAQESMKNNPQFMHIHFTPEFQRMFVQLSSALKYKEPVLLCGQTGCGKTTACQLYANLLRSNLIMYNCHLNTESSDFVGNVRPSRGSGRKEKFPWHDGPLVQAMKQGSVFLIDEISLADDAVLERINSVLEPDRSITITEKDGVHVRASEDFRFVATMNPGGDYGKKELSPALRNRFTEIYCHNTTDIKQIVAIIQKSLLPALLKPKIAPRLIKVMTQFISEYYHGQDIISLRDVLGWTKFLNKTTNIASASPLSIQDSIINGACLVFFDQFGTCGHKAIYMNASDDLKNELKDKLIRSVEQLVGKQPVYYDEKLLSAFQNPESFVKFGKFSLRKGPNPISIEQEFILNAPTVETNAEKIARALQLDRPILLEGDPGAGKTSIVSALARITGHKLVRINLSEQTDISDLFGSDLPDVSNSADEEPRFCWHDGPMLRAIKDSIWILLDEMNLASQSVLEGLNACFDHRGEIYIPELDKKFNVDRSTTRIFACQNPYNQGAARKGLPQSFLNRFTSIYVESHTYQDLVIILRQLFPSLHIHLIEKMIAFNNEVSSIYRLQGYEFNLRDLIYWCELLTKYVRGEDFKVLDLYEPDRFVQFVYIDRLRSLSDKADVCDIFEKIFGYPVYEPPYRDIKIGEHSMLIARSSLSRKNRPPPHLAELCVLKYQMPYMESIAKALEFNEMPILVGESGVGKRSMLRILAGLTGNELNIIGANSDMDTVELLGSYEQKSLQRELVDLVDEAAKFTFTLINSVPRRSQCNSLKQLLKHIWSTLYSTTIREHRLSKTELMEAYRFQLAQLEELFLTLQPLSVNQTESKCKDLQKTISNLKKKVLFQSESTYSSGNFEWIGSVLVKSIKEGSWLMIENANFMNPATLDRLNSLVEPNGTLSLNEKGSGPDGIEVLKPHPDFRLILTMNPEYGELSRAMRNRGVEIYVRTRFYYEDFLMLLNQVGFVIQHGTACMTYCIMQTSYDTHVKITEERPEDDGSLLAYFGLNYSPILAHQIRRGVTVETILSDLLLSFYHQRGHLENNDDESIREFIGQKMNQYRGDYVVDVQDERYKWMNFRHDLMSMTGGDAAPTTLLHERKLLKEFSCPISIGLFKYDEMIENFDIVNFCTAIKIFMELSSSADFEYRFNCIKHQCSGYTKMLDLIDAEIGSMQQECLPMISQELPAVGPIPPNDMYLDTRNSPDFHHTLLSLGYNDTISREDLQNRWILTLYRINLSIITELIRESSFEGLEEGSTSTSLWSLSEKVRVGEMRPEDLIRPQAEIATDLYDLLNGLTQFVGNRCFPNHLVVKIMSRLFWISYFSCKLKKALTKDELIATCNQIPMLWALTYQKVVVPLIEDCELADLSYNNKKFSSRLKHICDFLDVNVSKPGKIEKQYYNKVLNRYAATTKRCESISREVDKFFNRLIGRYTVKSQAMAFSRDDNAATLAASILVWSTSKYMTSFFAIADILLQIEAGEEDTPERSHKIKEQLTNAANLLLAKREEYDAHEQIFLNIKDGESYREKCLNIHRRHCALDQFSPIWQTRFIHGRLSAIMLPDMGCNGSKYNQELIRRALRDIDGIIMSPRYYCTLNKFLQAIEIQPPQQKWDLSTEEASLEKQHDIHRRNFNMYAAFLVDHMHEINVLDHQLVGWIKLRVTTSDLSSSAPYIPEYSPIISLVSSYCLDITHLKLNSYRNSNPQLDSMLIYLWRGYANIKFDSSRYTQDYNLAKNLIHLRLQLGGNEELIGNHTCSKSVDCGCVAAYTRLRAPKYDQILATIKEKADFEDRAIFKRALELIYFGFYHLLEYAPIFTLDPSLKFREISEVYKSELSHIKVDLHLRNTLHYWKTGENLRLVDVSPEEAKLYPFTIRVLVERRAKLEKSLSRLRREFTNRPKSDDGSLYYELRKEVEIAISRNTNSITALVNDVLAYLHASKKSLAKSQRLSHLNTKCRMFIKSLERSIGRFKSDFVLYSDLTTHYLTGSCFVLQGMRLLYSKVEQKSRLDEMGFKHCLVDRFSNDMMRLFSFSNFTLSNMESVKNKQILYTTLPAVCPDDRASHVQSLVLRSILIQLNHHIIMTPSDIERCIPIVHNVADKFHRAWLERKERLEKQREEQEKLYKYKPSSTIVNHGSFTDRQEFLEVAEKFPLYDHLFQDTESLLDNDKSNLETEAQITNFERSVDLSMCIDLCKAHYKFMIEASQSLLGLKNSNEDVGQLREIDMRQLVKLESEILYTMIRKCVASFDAKFDSLSLEYHLLQTNELIETLRRTQSEQIQVGSLRSSIEILDEEIFDIYHSASPSEALKFQEFLTRVDDKINLLRSQTKGYDTHNDLTGISKLTARISSFLITDPLIKLVTGAHTLLEQFEHWNKNVPKDSKMIQEAEQLIGLIQSWRAIEIKSWRSSLHRVKRKYIDDTLCDLWFRLYELFSDPIGSVRGLVERKLKEDYPGEETSAADCYFDLYAGFCALIKEFIEGSTLGDYQIRLDLVFSFAIQTRFASLSELSKPSSNRASVVCDYEKLTTCVYNTYRSYQAYMEPLKHKLSRQEVELSKELNDEIRIVNWQCGSLWDLKNNFRISHRKLNKVMNKYLGVLSQKVEIFPQDAILDKDPGSPFEKGSVKLATVFEDTHRAITQVYIEIADNSRLLSLKRAPKITSKLIGLIKKVLKSSKMRYLDVLEMIEKSIDTNTDLIQTFHDQNVTQVRIDPKDSKEEKEEKLKTCRQIYHSKKYALQSIFKNVQELGASFQRGSQRHHTYDEQIMSNEPLRGMIQNQSQSALKAASSLIEDALVMKCNEMYTKVICKNNYLESFKQKFNREDINAEQSDRITGYASDMSQDILLHSRNVALIYKHMMNIQASSTRLQQLKDRSTDGKIIVYKFKRIYHSINNFHELASRAYASISKLEMLMGCFKTYSDLQTLDAHVQSRPNSNEVSRERKILRDLIGEINTRNSLMTPEQHKHLQDNLSDVRKGVDRVCSALRDKLKQTIKNHLYSDDDLQDIQQLYEDFVSTLSLLLPPKSDRQLNVRSGTILGAIKSLSMEAEQKLKPTLTKEYLSGHVDTIDIDGHSNFHKLDIRLQKLMKEVELAAVDLYKDELDFVKPKDRSESAKRMRKPFNHIDSERLRDLLRPEQVAQQLSNCFKTLNLESHPTNIEPIVAKLTPILSIYTHQLTRYLNVILLHMHLKLVHADRLITFFIDLVCDGFGLPYKIEDLEGGAGEMTNDQPNEDNVGFGEGQGVNDASNKLEFESQLDELKKDGSDGQNGNQDEEKAAADEHVDAHDDGIEMTDDFDAKAEGPEDQADQEQPEEDQEPEDEDALNDLDKEFDEVDQDEGNLDQHLWDDEDEPLGEDDESDLREADLEQSEMDQKGLMARDADLKESENTNGDNLESQEDHSDEDEDEASGAIDDKYIAYDAVDDDEMEDNTDGGNDDETSGLDDTKMDDEEIKSSNSDAISSFEMEENGDPDEGKPEDKSEKPDEMLHDSGSEVEIVDDSAESVEKTGQDGSGAQGEAPSGSKVDTNQDDTSRRQAGQSKGASMDEQKVEESDSMAQGENTDQRESTEGADTNQEQTDELSTDDKSSKRTFAHRSSIDQQQTIKRQKIESAALGEEKERPVGDSKKQDDADNVRHLNKDTSSAMEVIDILSDSEDDDVLDKGADKVDQQQTGKPRELKSKDGDADNDKKQGEGDHDKSDENTVRQQSIYNTNLGLLKYISHGAGNKESSGEANELSESEQATLMEQIDNVLKLSSSNGEHESIEADRLTGLWLDCTKSTSHLIHELCQQLQIILQPTKMSKYKGDYKSGKRLNMRKIISYIASQYRKDKIWLRRTKPCKRTYNISLAVDNSSSMSENNCRQMTYQSLALLAKSLSLIEAGSLNVVSFGEKVKCIHEFDQPYVDAIGAQWLRELRFDESRTSYTKLLKYSFESFKKQAQRSLPASSNQNIHTSVNQLLIIISDGRNVTSDQEDVKYYLRQLKSIGVLTLFLIIDDLKQNNGKSIMDVKSCVRFDGTMLVEDYMALFPFPFYVLLRQLEAMPSILGDALRQWFELVINSF